MSDLAWRAEEHVLGAVLAVPKVLAPVLGEAGLRPEHFSRPRNRAAFEAICALNDEGSVPELLAVEKRMNGAGDRDTLATLAAKCPAPGNAAHYARLVIDAAQWRGREQALVQMREAVEGRDESAFGDARHELDQGVRRGDAYLDPEALRDLAYDVMDGGGKQAFPWPFERLNRLGAGGMRRGQFVVIAGHTHFGKSAWCDQVLEHVVRDGARACLYINEMDPEERIGGWLQRLEGVPFESFIQGKVSEPDRKRVLRALNRGFGFGLCPIAGWDAREVAAHIRLHRWDVCAIDILHRFAHREERDIAEIVELFAETAKLADCALILVAHVNRNRVQSGVRPRPTRGDLRGSGSIENDADIVCFVHREQDPETYEPLPEAYVYFDKYRGGRLGGLGDEHHPLRFNQERLRFEPVDRRFGAPSEPRLEVAA